MQNFHLITRIDFKFSTVYILVSVGGLSWRLLATFSRLYWKIKYVSRLQYLSEDIKKGEVQIPDFVKSHNKVLEDRPLADYGIDPIPST